MAVHDDIFQALHDAIGWQIELADAHRHCDDEMTEQAEAQIKRYRAILKRRYGTAKHWGADMLEDARPIGIEELRKLAPTNKI